MSVSTILMLAGGIIFLVNFGLSFRGRGSDAKAAPVETAGADNLAVSVKEMHEKLDKVIEKQTLVSMDGATKIRELKSRIQELERKKEKTSDDEMYQKGLEFEIFVVNIFKKDRTHFTCLYWSGDKGRHMDIYIKDAGNPDLNYDFSRKGKTHSFAVECKWRKGFDFGFAKDYQLKNYKDYEERTGRKTFIALGVGGKPSNPTRIFIIPVNEINNTKLPESELGQYEQENKKTRFWYHAKAKALILH